MKPFLLGIPLAMVCFAQTDVERLLQLHQDTVRLSQERKYAEAQTVAESAVSLAEKFLDAEHPATATVLSDLAYLYVLQGQYAKAELLFVRELAIVEKAFGAGHPNITGSLNNLAAVYRMQGQFAKAEPLLVRALAITEKAPESGGSAIVQSLNNLAVVYEELAQYAKAEPLLTRALAFSEHALGAEHPDTVITLTNLAALYEEQGQSTKAEPLLLRALAVREKAPESGGSAIAHSLNNLAEVYISLGEFAKAEPLLARALAIADKALVTEGPETATYLNSLAGLYQKQKQYAKAEPLLLRALAIRERAFGAEHPAIAESLESLGALYSMQAQYDRAEPLLLRALAINEKSLGAEHPATANSLSSLGSMYSDQREYGKAEPLLLRALAIREKALGTEHPLTATLLNNLGLLYDLEGNFAKAEPLFVRALAVDEKMLGADHPETIVARDNLLTKYLQTGDQERAQRLLKNGWPSQLKYLEHSLNFADEAWRRKALADFKEDFALLVATQSYRPSLQTLGLQSILASKGRVFEDTITELLSLKSQLPANLQTKLGELLAVRHDEAGLAAQRTTAAQARMRELNLEDDRLSQDLAERSPVFRSLMQTPKVEEVAAQLGNGALVEMVSFEDLSTKKTPHCGAYLLTGDGKIRWLDLGLLSDVDVLVARYRTAMNSPANEAGANATAREIDHLTLEPIRKALPDVTEFYVAADGQLRLVPWAVLRDENGVVLIEKYQIHTLLTGRDLVRGTPLASAQPPWVGGLGEFGKTVARPRFARIPGAVSEAEAVANVIQPEPQMLKPEQMTRSFLLENLNGPQILHLATHGYYQEAHGGLALTNANLSEENVLSDSDVAKLKLFGTRLVVLSACSTGLGEVSFADGITGLQRALTLAGARSQILTLWPVSDAKTKELMVSFYRNLFEKGMTKAEALRQAQLAMARQGVAEYYWAPFVLYGDGGPLLGPEISSTSTPRSNVAELEGTQGQSAKAEPPPLTPRFVLSPRFTLTTRQVGDVTIVDLDGRFVIGEPTKVFRQAIRDLVVQGHKTLLINLSQISYMDESGIGELITAFTTATNAGGQLKLVGLSQRIKDLLQITKLYTVFQAFDDETEAVLSFR